MSLFSLVEDQAQRVIEEPVLTRPVHTSRLAFAQMLFVDLQGVSSSSNYIRKKYGRTLPRLAREILATVEGIPFENSTTEPENHKSLIANRLVEDHE